MKYDRHSRLWPFGPRIGVISSTLILVSLLITVVVLRITIQWPSQESESAVLIGILLLSLLPVSLALVDVIVERGGSIEYKGLKIDLAQVPPREAPGFTMPANIGFPSQPLSDSNTNEILDTLRQATACDVVIIDLKEGQEWWETRLMVLLTGAVRLQRPEKLVFVGTKGGVQSCFQGWGYAYKLLRCLLRTNPQYERSYQSALAAGRQWALAEPNDTFVPNNPAPPQPAWIDRGLATKYSWMAFDVNTGLPNLLLTEQLLAADLGEKVEGSETPKGITLIHLAEIFAPVLHTHYIDESWELDRQRDAFFEDDSQYIAVTKNGTYQTMVSRLNVLNTIVKNMESGT